MGLPGVESAAAGTRGFLFLAHGDKALKAAAAFPADELIDGHDKAILAENAAGVHAPEKQDGLSSRGVHSPRHYLTRAMASISILTSRGRRATWTAARAGQGALKNSA